MIKREMPMTATLSIKGKTSRPKRNKATEAEKFRSDVMKFYSNLGLDNLPKTNNKLTMFPYEPYQTTTSAVSETNQ